MEKLIHRTPSVGSVVKKIMGINPNLTAVEMIDIIKKCTKSQGQSGIALGEFSQAEIIDEAACIRLAQLHKSAPSGLKSIN